MTSEDFLAELEREWEWRTDEIRHLKNLIGTEPVEVRRNDFRKALVVLLYSHFEGFCVLALQHYRDAVNMAGLSCRSAIPAIVAGAWDKVFSAMQSGDAKCKIFANALPDDANLHTRWRRRHFVEEVDRLNAIPVVVPEDTIDSESNLKVSVLKRNLFLLGLEHSFVDAHSGSIQRLLTLRNGVAHGTHRNGIQEPEYVVVEDAVNNVCEQLIVYLDDAFRNQRFRKIPLNINMIGPL